MKTPEYLDLLREKLHLPSDYALQKPLNVSKSQVSSYRNGRDFFSDPIAVRVAELTGMEAWKVLLDSHIERSKTPETRAAWMGLAEKLSESFLNLLSGRSPRRYRVSAR